MIKRHFEACEELKSFAAMKERVYTMLAESGFSKNLKIAEILEAIDASEDAEDIIANYIDERIELIERIDGQKGVRKLEKKISDIFYKN